MSQRRKGYINFIFFFLVSSFCFSATAQKTVISGKIIDALTKEALPFVNVSFEGGQIGTTTNMEGEYYMETLYPTTYILVSYVGYTAQKKEVVEGVSQVINFEMAAGELMLEEFVVKPDKKAENPAHRIIRRVQRNSEVNNRKKLDSYSYEVYNKIEFDINNISDELQNKKILKPFEFVFDQLDTTGEKPYLPIFISESISNLYYRKKPKDQKEIIHATRISGLERSSISQFMGDMYQQVNVYEPSISVFGKPFISPISGAGFVYYKYYLLDSLYIDNNWCYEIKFIPRSYFEPVFDGTMWINDTTFAVKKIEAEISEHANINFVQSLKVIQEFDQVEPEVWMITKDQLIVDFNPFEKSTGFYGRKTSTYRKFKINDPEPDAFYSGLEDVILSKNLERDKTFWDNSRHEALTAKEEAIYQMVDSIKNVPMFSSVVDIMTVVIGGYQRVGSKFEVGPYFNLYSFNTVESHRFRLGLRTSSEWMPRMQFSGFGAYGTGDKKMKYGGGFKYIIRNHPRRQIDVSYRNDIAQLGQAQDLFLSDNVFASVFRRNPANKLNLIDEVSGSYFHEWFNGFSTRLGYANRSLEPLGALEFIRRDFDGSARNIPRVANEELQLGFRFAFREKFALGEHTRISLGTAWPILEFHYFKGLQAKGFTGFNYEKYMLRMSQEVNVGQLGVLEYRMEVGRIHGDVAFPFLEIHRGNETFFFDKFAFNTMNYFEFLSDEYAQVMAEHHFNGFFLNKFPLLRRLKLREVFTFKAVAGRLRDDHRRFLEFPKGFNRLSKPFMEGAFGIENIFSILRMDVIYRLSYLDNPDIIRYGIRARFQLDF